MKPPVSYQGGKTRLAKQIVDYLDYKGGPVYDVCCGCGAISLELLARGAKPSDITMVDCGPWGAVWESVSKGDFDCEKLGKIISRMPTDPAEFKAWVKAKWAVALPDQDTIPYWFLLFQAASFGGSPIWIENGVWKKGGGWRSYWLPKPHTNRQSPVNPMMPMPATLLRRMEAICETMRGVNAHHDEIKNVNIDPRALVYVDPPYTGLTGYGNDFDAVDFAKGLSNIVWVSEARALAGGEGILVTKGRAKGGVNGLRKTANEEWLTRYAP